MNHIEEIKSDAGSEMEDMDRDDISLTNHEEFTDNVHLSISHISDITSARGDNLSSFNMSNRSVSPNPKTDL
mgnify:CR=1 FL=1